MKVAAWVTLYIIWLVAFFGAVMGGLLGLLFPPWAYWLSSKLIKKAGL